MELIILASIGLFCTVIVMAGELRLKSAKSTMLLWAIVAFIFNFLGLAVWLLWRFVVEPLTTKQP